MQSILQWIRQAKLKDWLRLIDRIIPHVAIVLSGMLITFFLIDRVNKPMAFMTNEFHKRITFILALLCVYLAVRRMAYLRAREREEMNRRPRQAPPPRRADPAPRYDAEPSRAGYDRYGVRRSASTAPRRESAYPARTRTQTRSDYEPDYSRRRRP